MCVVQRGGVVCGVGEGAPTLVYDVAGLILMLILLILRNHQDALLGWGQVEWGFGEGGGDLRGGRLHRRAMLASAAPNIMLDAAGFSRVVLAPCVGGHTRSRSVLVQDGVAFGAGI